MHSIFIRSTFWSFVLVASLIAMIVVFVYTLDDHLSDPIVIKFDPVVARKTSVFPAVSVCIEKTLGKRVDTDKVEHFIKKYYAEHNIAEPQK